MKLIEVIMSDSNIDEAVRRVKANNGAAGIDGMKASEAEAYIHEHIGEIRSAVLEMRYHPQPVRRVFIPKRDGGKRPLGIPAVIDRVIQQAAAQVLMRIYDPEFSESSFGFRPRRSAHDAIEATLMYLNEGYDWIVDLDIQKYFDTVNHDRLISVLRGKINDKATLHLIRAFLKAGVMENGAVMKTEKGVPQGGPLSPVLSNIYLDKLDKELEKRGLRFARYADDCDIFVKSETAAERVMRSVSSWLERKLFLKASPRKTKVVRPTRSEFLGFSYWKTGGEWKARPAKSRKKDLYDKTRNILCRRKAAARSLHDTIDMLNQLIRGWISYYSLGSMKTFIRQYSEWMRHKLRAVLLKQWKRPRTIYRNLMAINAKRHCHIESERIRITANSRKGLYASANGDVVNFIISPKLLHESRKRGGPGLVDPCSCYLRSIRNG